MRCEYCGIVLDDDNRETETICTTCWDFWESDYDVRGEEE